MKIVVDTNVLVSGLLKPFSTLGEIVRMVTAANIQLCYDARILSEYREVLLRPKFEFNLADVENLLVQIEASGFAIASSPLSKHLPDPHDEPFLEVALAGNAHCLVTGNTKHYPAHKRQGMTIISPTEFLEGKYKK